MKGQPTIPERKASVVLAYIIRYKSEHDGIAPGIRQIAETCGFSSTSMAALSLQILVKRGSICLLRTGEGGSQRGNGIQVVGGRWLHPSLTQEGTHV